MRVWFEIGHGVMARRDAEGTKVAERSIIGQSVHYSKETMLNKINIETDRQSESQARRFETCKHPLLVYWMYGLDRCQPEENLALYYDISAKPEFKNRPVILHGNRPLTLTIEAYGVEFIPKRVFVHGLQEPRTQGAMDSNVSIENQTSKLVFYHLTIPLGIR